MGAFLGQLNQNEIYSSFYNMIISQEVFDRIGDSTELVDGAKVDGGLYGDTKLFYAADALASYAWGNDAEASNLLALNRPAAPEVQSITLDQFRQIRLTLDDYLSKRAWSDEGAFGQFNALMEGMIGKTKRIYDVTLYNAFIGTAKGEDSASAEQKVEVSVASNEKPETEAKKIAKSIADLMVELKTVSRKFNTYGHITKFDEEEVKVVWNSEFINRISKLDLPAIFHSEGLMDKFGQYVLPSIYFGTIATASSDVGANKIIKADGTYDSSKGVLRAADECTLTVGVTTKHYFAGEALDNGASVYDTSASAFKVKVYIPDDSVIAKVMVKLPPYMSAFEVGTTFFNPRSLTTNRYLTFGHNTLEVLEAYPFITIYEKVTEDVVGDPVKVVNSEEEAIPTTVIE